MFQPNHKKKNSYIKLLLKSYIKLLLGQTGDFEFHFLEEQKKAPKCKQQYQDLKTDTENILL